MNIFTLSKIIKIWIKEVKNYATFLTFNSLSVKIDSVEYR